MLAELRVLHGAPATDRPAISIPGALHLTTCQRELWVFHADDGDATIAAPGLSTHSGAEAYALLLRVACGLESQVLGETDVFGQLKQEWKRTLPELRSEVDFWIRKTFEDAKEIRSRYLEHLGGVSYGTLVRKFLRERVSTGPTLLVGAGALAQSVGPFLAGQEIWLWNRSVARARSLATELIDGHGARVRVLETANDEDDGWRRAAQAIACIPLDPGRDPARAALWGDRTILHLGARRAQAGVWASLKKSFFLDDLFALQKTQREVRSLQISQARKACDERAKLRSLGASVSIHHGWEDLALFA